MILKPLPGLILVLSLGACGESSTPPATAPETVPQAASPAPVPGQADILPDVPDGVQAISLLGEELRSASPSPALLDNLAAAKADYDANPNDADNIIWYGRRIAYTGDYRAAIGVFSEGVAKFPHDARMYRHRGHRYISVREFDRAITDFERAVVLIGGSEDTVEPDGAPNAQGIPVSTLHSNIRYHLGLAYYLKGDLDNALRVYRIAIAETPNDDMRVATTHWLYMTLRLLGRDDEALAALEPIEADMNVIESMAYHQLCLLYKGEGEMATALGAGVTPAGGDSAMYGVGNWHLYNNRTDEAKAMFERMMAESGWASFGRIAAESDLSRKF
jgi:tetratricopeptide (TPR) repeat protein